MLLSATSLHNPLYNNANYVSFFPFFPHNFLRRRPLKFTCVSSSFTDASSIQNSSLNPNQLRHVTHTVRDDDADGPMILSASAVASAILRASTSPVEFVQRIEKSQKTGFVLPSSDFQRLCIEQLDLFRRIVDPDALLSVYVRPAGSYVMDRLELRRVISYPGVNVTDVVILVGNFSIPTGLRAAEAAFSSQQVEVIPEINAVVFPMVKHPFVVGFLVAELPNLEMERCMDMQSADHDLRSYPSPRDACASLAGSETNTEGIQTTMSGSLRTYEFNADLQSNAFHMFSCYGLCHGSAMILKQSSWQNNIRMGNLVEQIRSSLSSIQTLSKMLSVHMKKNEIAYEILEDILLQGNHMRDTLQQLQDAVYLTKANIVHYNEETLRKMYKSSNPLSESVKNQLDDFSSDASSTKMRDGIVSSNTTIKDLEMPMPPMVLAPVQHEVRSCNVSDVLIDLVEAVKPLAQKQRRVVKLSEQACSLQIAVEESALRQALSNLIEGALLRTHVGGKVEIVSTTAPAGGALIVIDDDGPDMHYMTQMHSLTSFGADLLSDGKVEDNMTWNFVAGLTVACEILESYGCIVRVISPRSSDAALGAGGTRLELWLPCVTGTASHNFDSPTQEA